MGEFAATLSNVNQQMIMVDQKITELFAKANGLLSKIPGFLGKPIVIALGKVKEIAQKMWDEIRVWCSEPGSPPRLFAAAKVLHQVQANTTAQAGKMVETYLKVDDHWTGDAAEQYKKVAKPEAPQTMATKQYGNTADKVASALDTCGYTIIGYWVALGAAFATACIGVVSIVGAVPAILYAAGCIGAFLVAAGVALAAAVTVMGTAADTFRSQNSGNDNFPDGWPPSGVPAAT
jgi:hypothetical protein